MIRFCFSMMLVGAMVLSNIFCVNAQSAKSIQKAAEKLSAEPLRAKGQTDVLQLRCEAIPVVRIGVIGLGMRGASAIPRFMNIENVEVTALCDLEPYNIAHSQSDLQRHGRKPAKEYLGEDAWKRVCEADDVDLVYICTDWLTHTPMCIYAMEHGKHVACEVPIARTIEECWQLVNTAERTRKHCIMLENCCYDFFEMATLNMAQKGLFGEVVHVEGAYIHDLRWLNFAPRLNEKKQEYKPAGADGTPPVLPHITGYWNYWRLKENAENNGNLYPTHGLGPICQILNIHRGDKMSQLVSMSSNQFNMTAYAKEKFGENSKEAKATYLEGDMNTTIVRTEKGKTIMIQHDVASPRPYSRIHLVSGTKGFAQKYPTEQLAFEPHSHNALSKEKMEEMLAEYEHPITKEVGELARKVGGHGGMDFIMDYRLIYCLQRGLPLDMDVYDAAEWCCITELSEFSVKHNSFPIRVPDFTRGAWNKLKGYEHAY